MGGREKRLPLRKKKKSKPKTEKRKIEKKKEKRRLVRLSQGKKQSFKKTSISSSTPRS